MCSQYFFELKTHEKRKVTVLFISNFCRFKKIFFTKKRIKRLTAKYQSQPMFLALHDFTQRLLFFLKKQQTNKYSQSILGSVHKLREGGGMGDLRGAPENFLLQKRGT